MLNKIRPLASLLCVASLMISASISAQDNSSNTLEEIDEIIVEGIAGWAGHKGMTAFMTGDFETAEIEFEREFISLKRADNGRYNAAVDAALSLSRAGTISEGTVSNNPTNRGPSNTSNGGAVPVGNFGNQGKKGKNILNDGVLSYQDFALTKYMSGLSELKLGKYKEAKKSLKTSVYYQGDNYDARMRLGLLYLKEKDIEKAAKQLEKIEKTRVKCKKKNCEEYDEILESASTLATHLTKSIKS